MFRSLLLSLIILGITAVCLPLLLYFLFSIVVHPDAWGSIGWIFGLFILPSAFVGLYVGIVGYASGHWARQRTGGGASFSHALIIGISSGVFGAVPVGWLASVSGLGISFPVAMAGSGVFLALVFTSYVALWQRRMTPELA